LEVGALEESWPFDERLSSIAADLLSERRYEPFVRRLFASPPGEWQGVAACCSGLPVLPDFSGNVFAEHAESFVVTHLPWPGSPDGDRYALVVFVHLEELWSTVASYNLATLGHAS
jgi:hypothetical protein